VPSWIIHSKVYKILGLNQDMCRIIDNLVDKEPPTEKEVFVHIASNERLPVHFGFNKAEFPYIYSYVLRKYGVEGVKCLLAHFVLDRVENVLKRGYTSEMVRDVVEALLEDYREECRISKGLCGDYAGIFKDMEERLSKHMETIVNEVGKWLKERMLPVEILVNASTEMLSLMLRVELYLKGYRGKRGFSVNREVYVKTYARAKNILKQKIFNAILNNEIRDLDKILESINRIKQQLAAKRKITISDYGDLARKEQERNSEFKAYTKILKRVVAQAIEEYEKLKK